MQSRARRSFCSNGVMLCRAMHHINISGRRCVCVASSRSLVHGKAYAVTCRSCFQHRTNRHHAWHAAPGHLWRVQRRFLFWTVTKSKHTLVLVDFMADMLLLSGVHFRMACEFVFAVDFVKCWSSNTVIHSRSVDVVVSVCWFRIVFVVCRSAAQRLSIVKWC